MRIAVASSNGEDLDLHFGKAHSLYVYDYDDEKDEFNFIDQRKVKIEVDMKHQNPKIIKAIEELSSSYAVKKRNAESISDKIGTERGVETAVRLIEEVLA